MLDNTLIFLESSELYKRIFWHFFDRPGEAIPNSFSYNERLDFQLIDPLPGDGIRVEQNQGVLAVLDDRYFLLRDYSRSEVKTVWYNPSNEIISDELPVHDVDLGDLEGLKDVLPLLHKPSLAQCLDWWDVWDVPENIRRHSSVVARSAYVVGMKMRDRGISLDPILAHRAGLLHDIDKIDTLEESGAHGAMGADFLDEQGYPEIAEIVRGHIMSTILDPDALVRGWENKLVFFCDKLVEGDMLVPFDQRLAALKIRYPFYVEKMEKAESAIWNMSDEICGILRIPGHELLVEMIKEMM